MNAIVRRFALAALLLLALPAANASAGAWEISPFARYITNAEFDFVSDNPAFLGYSVLADKSIGFGAGIGYMTNSTFEFEAEYQYQPTGLDHHICRSGSRPTGRT